MCLWCVASKNTIEAFDNKFSIDEIVEYNGRFARIVDVLKDNGKTVYELEGNVIVYEEELRSVYGWY